MSGVRTCKGELPLHIDGGEYVPFRAVYEADDGIELHTLLVPLGTAYLLAIGGVPFERSPRSC